MAAVPYRACITAIAATALLIVPPPSEALAPALAFMAKQIVQQAATSMIKDALLGSLRNSGCKGIALANGLSALDARGGARMGFGAGMPSLPPGLSGVPGAAAVVPGAAMPGPATGAVMPSLGAGGAMPAMPAGTAEMLGKMMPPAGALPPGAALDPSQLAMLQQMQAAMSQPVSPAETLATMDEMAEIGLLPKAMQTEMKECMTLLPQTAQGLGMAMGMMKPMLGQLREARAQMHALPPQEQDEMAAMMANELQSASAEDRTLFLEHLGGGFFPPRVSEGVKARLSVR